MRLQMTRPSCTRWAGTPTRSPTTTSRWPRPTTPTCTTGCRRRRSTTPGWPRCARRRRPLARTTCTTSVAATARGLSTSRTPTLSSSATRGALAEVGWTTLEPSPRTELAVRHPVARRSMMNAVMAWRAAVSLRRNVDRCGLLELNHLPPRHALADARAQAPAQRLLLVFDGLGNGGDPASRRARSPVRRDRSRRAIEDLSAGWS